jgi:type IV pilus assembly protein PilP
MSNSFAGNVKLVVLGVAMFTFSLSACESDVLPETPVKKKAAPAPVAALNPDGGVDSGGPQYIYVYNPLGKRDPFRGQAVEATVPTGDQIKNEVCAEPLCQYDLDDLKLVAVVSGDANPIAMVEDRAGVGHIVHRNSNMGRQGGKVSAVLRDCIQVTNYVLGPDGKRQPNRVDMCAGQADKVEATLDLMQGKMK